MTVVSKYLKLGIHISVLRTLSLEKPDLSHSMEIVWKFEFLENFHIMEIDKSMEISWKSAFPYFFERAYVRVSNFHIMEILWKYYGSRDF
jgi:hypothetical protein